MARSCGSRTSPRSSYGSSFLTPGGGTGTTENFVRIGHSLFALIVGWLGGALSRKFRPSH